MRFRDFRTREAHEILLPGTWIVEARRSIPADHVVSGVGLAGKTSIEDVVGHNRGG